jgi:hypothetical protein
MPSLDSRFAFALGLALSMCAPGTATDEVDNSSIGLRTWKNVKTEWIECVGKSGQECVELIERDLGGHPFRFLRPEVFVPRDEKDYNNTYFKVGISINLLDEVTGDKNLGTVRYPLPWDSEISGPRVLDLWDCAAMKGVDCCSKIMASVPDKDANGNNLECFIYQDPVTPDVERIEPKKARQGYIAKDAPYFMMKHNKPYDVYVKLDVNDTRIGEFRLETRKRLILNQRELEKIVEVKRVSFEDLSRLTRELALNTSPIMSAQNLISNLDHFLEDVQDAQFLRVPAHSDIIEVITYLIHLIKSYLDNREQFFTPLNVLVTGQDVVIVPPKLGAKFLPIQTFRPLEAEK